MDINSYSIDKLNIGDSAVVVGYRPCDPSYRQQLLSMGLTPQTTIQLVRRAPLGDPVVIKLRNYELTLRQGEANILKLMPVRVTA